MLIFFTYITDNQLATTENTSDRQGCQNPIFIYVYGYLLSKKQLTSTWTTYSYVDSASYVSLLSKLGTTLFTWERLY